MSCSSESTVRSGRVNYNLFVRLSRENIICDLPAYPYTVLVALGDRGALSLCIVILSIVMDFAMRRLEIPDVSRISKWMTVQSCEM